MRLKILILCIGVLIAASSAGAILVINRYEVSQPFNRMLFKRFDRWTGKVENCSSIYDNTTYCDAELARRVEWAGIEEELAERRKLLSSGYTQKQIDSWPANVLQFARNLVSQGKSKAEIDEQLAIWFKLGGSN